jgi:hypothetical protein
MKELKLHLNSPKDPGPTCTSTQMTTLLSAFGEKRTYAELKGKKVELTSDDNKIYTFNLNEGRCYCNNNLIKYQDVLRVKYAKIIEAVSLF